MNKELEPVDFIKKNSILYRAWKRIHYKDTDTLIAVCGETGSRMSGSASTLARLIDEANFNKRERKNE